MLRLFRAAGWTLRQKRYATLAAALWVLMLVCVAAGTFELHRYLEKHQDNSSLRANSAAATTPLTPRLVPLTGGPKPDSVAIRYRTVDAAGTFVDTQTRYVGGQSQGGKRGSYVLTPLRTPSGSVLVVRGFVAGASRAAPAPTGVVHVVGRLQTPTSAIDPTTYAQRLGTPVYQAYVTAKANSAGTAGLTVLPRPGLSNPTGGASEWQLLSYVVQWYIFAFLLVIAPFLFARADARASRQRYLGTDEDAEQFDTAPTRADARAAIGESNDGQTLAVRGTSTLAQRDPAAAARLVRAQRLSDRYGRPLGPDPERAVTAPTASVSREQIVRDSTVAAYRAADDYHAQYNDYLWQLALADGDIPTVEPPTAQPDRVSRAQAPRVIESEPSEPED